MRSLHARVNCSPKSQFIQHIQLSEKTNPYKSILHLQIACQTYPTVISSPWSRPEFTVQVPATRSCHHPKGSPFLWMASANWWLASLHGKTPPEFQIPKNQLVWLYPWLYPWLNDYTHDYTHDYSEGTCLNMICIHQDICAVLFIPDLHFHNGSWPHL